jgi:hypothetical protein
MIAAVPSQAGDYFEKPSSRLVHIRGLTQIGPPRESLALSALVQGQR